MFEASVKNIPSCGGGLVLSAASNARICFSYARSSAMRVPGLLLIGLVQLVQFLAARHGIQHSPKYYWRLHGAQRVRHLWRQKDFGVYPAGFAAEIVLTVSCWYVSCRLSGIWTSALLRTVLLVVRGDRRRRRWRSSRSTGPAVQVVRAQFCPFMSVRSSFIKRLPRVPVQAAGRGELDLVAAAESLHQWHPRPRFPDSCRHARRPGRPASVSGRNG